MKIELNCAQCGSNRFAYPPGLNDGSLIICEECGHKIGTLAELQQKVIEALESRSTAARRLPGTGPTLAGS